MFQCMQTMGRVTFLCTLNCLSTRVGACIHVPDYSVMQRFIRGDMGWNIRPFSLRHAGTRGSSAFVSPWAAANRWERHQHLRRKSGLNHRREKKEAMWWVRAVVACEWEEALLGAGGPAGSHSKLVRKSRLWQHELISIDASQNPAGTSISPSLSTVYLCHGRLATILSAH